MAERPTGVTIVGILLILFGLLALLGGVMLMFVGTAMPGIALIPEGTEGAEEAAGMFTAIMGAMGVVMIVFGLLELLTGIFVLKGAGWARWIAIILGVLSLLSIPIGTIIGIVTIYFLLIDKKGKAFFESAKA